MRTIAIEEHFLADAVAEVMERTAEVRAAGPQRPRSPELQARLRDLGPNRLESMDAAGIDVQVISHAVSALESLTGDLAVRLARAANDQLAGAVAAHPDRYAGLAILPMSEAEAAAEELARAVRSLGFKGAAINGTVGGHFLDDPRFLPVLERAASLDVPIYLHPAEPPPAVTAAYYSGLDPAVSFFLSCSGWGWHSELAIHSLRLILAGVFDRLPGLQIIIGHMGEMIPFMLARIDATLGRVADTLELPVSAYFARNFHITTSGFFTNPPLLLALQTFGADRILFAVDYPYSPNEAGRRFLESMTVSPADKDKISHLNAERLLRLA